MIFSLKLFRKQIMGLPLSEAGFKARGMPEGHPSQERLEMVAKVALFGFNMTMEKGLSKDLEVIASAISKEMSGFFYEGIGMGLYALDHISLFKKDRFLEFTEGAGNHHLSIMYVGAGMAMAVLGSNYKKFLLKADPFRGIKVLDGMGFYMALKKKKVINDCFVPKSIKENAFFLERYDHGVGRALWFLNVTDPEKAAAAIAKFPEERRRALWAGIGLACAYARGGGMDKEKILLLQKVAGEHLDMVSQSVLLATYYRQKHNPAGKDYDPSLELMMTGMGPEECLIFVEKITNAMPELPPYSPDKKHPYQVFLEDVRDGIKARV